MRKKFAGGLLFIVAAGGLYLYSQSQHPSPPFPPPPASTVPTAPAPAVPIVHVAPDDLFRGHDRAAAKTSISSAPTETFADVGTLLATLPSDATMHAKHIPSDATSSRVTEEERNVTVHAFLWAAKHEDDNDYHLILGSTTSTDAVFLTAEVTGLPASGHFLDRLRVPRVAFLAHFAGHPPGSQSYHRYQPPVPVTVSGSLFYDVDHPPGAVGPAWAKPKTAWEIHPVTALFFGQ
jgi:hypothetical protein